MSLGLIWRRLVFPTQNSPKPSLARLTCMVRSKLTMVAYLIFSSNHLQTDLYLFLTSICCNASNRLFNLPTYLPSDSNFSSKVLLLRMRCLQVLVLMAQMLKMLISRIVSCIIFSSLYCSRYSITIAND